jgi:hypothetical protein
VRLDPDQLEWIVREVVRRLRIDSPPSSPFPPGEGQGEGAPRTTSPPKPDAHIFLTVPLVTTATLDHKLTGVTQITVPKKAVVTPAARDLLKEHNIELTRN